MNSQFSWNHWLFQARCLSGIGPEYDNHTIWFCHEDLSMLDNKTHKDCTVLRRISLIWMGAMYLGTSEPRTPASIIICGYKCWVTERWLHFSKSCSPGACRACLSNLESITVCLTKFSFHSIPVMQTTFMWSMGLVKHHFYNPWRWQFVFPIVCRRKI